MNNDNDVNLLSTFESSPKPSDAFSQGSAIFNLHIIREVITLQNNVFYLLYFDFSEEMPPFITVVVLTERQTACRHCFKGLLVFAALSSQTQNQRQ